ncbi:unnamed protein product [Dibothriocephalus latus]|uniref:Uncharacterized protein n=1 Tax=Dibothriocephalus latus TaxID=60516 RepID=A0A3P7LXY0_DIBLA|nr:unnamed protein product [Dibothriocephalus latus]
MLGLGATDWRRVRPAFRRPTIPPCASFVMGCASSAHPPNLAPGFVQLFYSADLIGCLPTDALAYNELVASNKRIEECLGMKA